MTRVSKHQFSAFSCRGSAWFLAFFFLCGLMCGVIACFGCGPEYSSLMRSCSRNTVSIVGLILSLMLPFLISYSCWVLNPLFLFPVCFCRAFLFGFVHFGLCTFCGDGGWLIRWMVCFSDCFSLPFLYFFWYRCLAGRGISQLCRFTPAGLLILIGILDFYLISPNVVGFLSLQKG